MQVTPRELLLLLLLPLRLPCFFIYMQFIRIAFIVLVHDAVVLPHVVFDVQLKPQLPAKRSIHSTFSLRTH